MHVSNIYVEKNISQIFGLCVGSSSSFMSKIDDLLVPFSYSPYRTLTIKFSVIVPSFSGASIAIL